MKRSRSVSQPRWFKLLLPAQAFADKHSLLVFSADTLHGGAKRFGVIPSHPCLYDYIQSTVDKPYYEVIRSDHPCCLYMDFDAKLPLGEAEAGEEKLNAFIAGVSTILATTLHKHYPAIPHRSTECVVLDSSGACGDVFKCSRHLHFPHLWFRNNAVDIPRFLETHVLGSVPALLQEVGLASSPLDLSVYSRNRSFRMMGCHKRKSKRVLRATCAIHDDRENQRIFFRALVQPPREPDHAPIAIGPLPRKSLVLTTSYPKLNAILDWFKAQDADLYDITPCANKALGDGLRFIVNTRSRYCTALKRHHSHNNTYYLLNLESGWISQRCHAEAACKQKGFARNKWKSWSVPRDLLPQQQSNEPLATLLRDISLDPEWNPRGVKKS
jgi:hypothetical protein